MRPCVAEHMRVPADEFCGDRLDHVAEIEGAELFGHAGVEDHLEEEIAQFILEIGQIVTRDGIGDLIGLFERVRRDGREILLEIPRTAGLGRAQRRHDREQAADIAGRGHHQES